MSSQRRRHIHRRIGLVLGLVASTLAAAAVLNPASAAPFAATASVAPQFQFLGDSGGTTFTVTVNNTGTVDSIGAVEVGRPGKTWTIIACPSAPAGWTAQRSDTMCRFRSAPGTADDIAPGQSSSAFQVTATAPPGTQNLTGKWTVKVSNSNNFDKPSKITAAASTPPGLDITAYSFQILDAVVDPSTVTPGAPCPAPNKTAITGSTGHTIAICGRNRTTGTLTPTAAQSSLGGSFIGAPGTFSSGAVAPSASSVVLGTWTGVTITGTSGSGKTVVAKIGSASNRTSPLTTLTGYEALNMPPVAADDNIFTDEDTPTTFDPRGNDSDPDGDPISVTAVDDSGSQGTVTRSGNDVTYDPDGAFDHLLPGDVGFDSFTYTIQDSFGASDTATVTVTVTGLNDAPTAVDDSPSIDEDAGPTSVLVLANDTDPDTGDTLSVASYDDTGTLGTVTNESTHVTYSPAGQFAHLGPGETATDTFTYTVVDGFGATDTATVTVTINGENDAPNAVNDSGAGFETTADASFTTANVLDNDTDPDGDTLSVSSFDDSSTLGVVTDNGDGTFGYDPNGAFDGLAGNASATDEFTYTVSDGNGGSDTATVTITIGGANHAPVAVDDSGTGFETGAGSSFTTGNVLANDTDEDGDTLTVSAFDDAATQGLVTDNGDGTFGYDPNGAFDSLPGGQTDTDTFTYTVSDGNGGSDTATVTITITGGNHAPVATDDTGPGFGEDDGAASFGVLGNDTDVDGDTLTVSSVDDTGTTGLVTTNGTTVTYDPNGQFDHLAAGATADDTFTYTVSDGNGGSDTATVTVTITGANDAPSAVDDAALATEDTQLVKPAPGVLGNDTDPDTGDTLTVIRVQDETDLSATTDQGGTVTMAADGSYTYDPPAAADALQANQSLVDGFTYAIADGSGAESVASVTITVNGVNDAPDAVDDEGTTDEDTTLNAIAPGVLANDTDPDAGDTQTVVQLNGSGTLTGTSAKGGTVTINANGSYSYAPPAAFQAMSTGESDTDSFTYTLSDGAGALDSATVNLTVNGVSDAPTATADSFNGVGNTGLFVGTTKPAGQPGKVITGSVLTNDTDPDTPHAELVAEIVTDAPTSGGGTVSIESDGNFTFHPDDGDLGADTFTYRVCDASPCDSTTVANATGTLTINLGGQVWYVRNNQAPGGDGTSDTPFDTLAEAEAASTDGDTTYVFDGDNTSTGLTTGYTMNSTEKLLGEPSDLQIGSDLLHTGVPANRPTLAVLDDDAVTLASGSTVRGLQLDPSGAGSGISASGFVTGTITIADVQVIDTGTAGTQPGVELTSAGSGSFAFSDLAVDNSTATGQTAGSTGVRLVPSITNGFTANFAAAGTISITTKGAAALDASLANVGTASTFDSVTVTGSAAGGILMQNTTGSATTFANLSLTTTGGRAFSLQGTGSVDVPASGTANINATGGASQGSVLVNGAAGSSFAFDDVTVGSNPSGGGIVVVGTGPFSAVSGSISNTLGTAVTVGAGSAAMTYPGTINNGAGRSVDINGRTGGTVTLSGAINDTNDSGGGIFVNGNSGGATVLSGVGKTLNTGTEKAIEFNNSDGHTLTISGGNLDVDSTTAMGIDATTSGTLTISGTGNTVATTANKPLNVVNTDIGAGGLTFQSITSTSSAGGVVLNNTGASGGLTVSGNGGTCATAADACSGGTISAASGDGFSLTSTRAVDLTRVKIINNLGNGIRGHAVTNLALKDSVVDNNGNDPATDEAGLHLTNLTGTSEITRTVVANSPEDNARIVNASGTLTQLNVTDSVFRDTDTAGCPANCPGNNGLLIQADGGSITADVLGSSFLRNRANGLQVVTNGSGSMNVEVDDSAGLQSSFDDNNIGVNLAHNSTGSYTYSVRDLSINGLNASPFSASPINLNLASDATTPMVGTVSGNQLTNNQSLTGPGIRVISNGLHNAVLTAHIIGNTISGVANRGIDVLARDGNSRINATIAGNSIDLTDPASLDAIRVDAGSISTDTTTICADITGNTADTDALGFNDIRIRNRQAGTSFILEDYSGSPTDTAAVVARLESTNTAPDSAADHLAGNSGFATTTECPMP